jgi:hypothetical protein
MELVRAASGGSSKGDYPQPTAFPNGGGAAKGGVAMIKEMSILHLASLAARKVASKERKEVIVRISPPYVPGFKRGTYETPYGVIKVAVWLDQQEGLWKAKVRFLDQEGFQVKELAKVQSA